MSPKPPGSIADLPRWPASDVKRRGWRGVVRALAAGGPVVVTNHAEPEAVIVSAAEYERLLILVGQATAKADAALDTLRHRFDERLAALQDPDAGPRLRSVMNRPAKLKGRVKAGRGY